MRKAWLDDQVIKVQFGGTTFHADLALIKGIVGRRFDPSTKIWSVPDTPENRNTLHLSGFNLSGDIAIDFVEEVDEDWKNYNITLPELRNGYTFYPFQKDALRFLLYHQSRAVLGLFMGGGKTLLSLTFIEMQEDTLPALIICPSPVKGNFLRDYEKFYGKDNVEILSGGDSLAKYKKKKIYVINYELLSRAVETKEITYRKRGGGVGKRKMKIASEGLARFAATGFKTVIADEVHRLKNEDANAFFAFKELSDGVPYVIGMSGTPILSRPSEIWSYWNTIKPNMWQSKQMFLNRYCDPKQINTSRGVITLYNGATNMLELNRKLRNNGLLVMDKEAVSKDLPPRPVRTVVPIEMDDYDKYLEARDEVLDEIYSNPSLLLTKFEKLKQLAGKYKYDHLVEYIDNILDIQPKVVIFADHQNMVEKLHKKYKGSVKFNGTMTAPQKEASKNQFINDPKCRVIVGNTQSMGTGVDGLQHSGAADIVFVEFPWNPSDLDQAEARLWRTGFREARGINVHYLVGAGTIEEEIIERLDTKKTVVDAVINGMDVDNTTLLTYLRDKYMAEAKLRKEHHGKNNAPAG